MPRTASIGIRVEPELKAAIERAAKADGRTVAQWIERLTTAALEAGGFLVPAPPPPEFEVQFVEAKDGKPTGKVTRHSFKGGVLGPPKD